MSTSGNRSFNMTTSEIISGAFRILNIIDMDKSPPASQYNFALSQLNGLVKQWQAEGLRLWNRKEGFLFTDYGTNTYSLGLTGDNCTNQYYQTTLSAAEASGQTILSTTDTSDITVSDKVGITLSDGTRQWTTVSSKTSSTITVANALTGAADSGALVVNYTSKIDRPLRILSARRRDMSNDYDVKLEFKRIEEYEDIPNKNTLSIPNLFSYEKQLGLGKLYLWPTPNDTNIAVNFTYYESIEDFTAQTDNPDFPQEWLLALQWGLATLLCIPYGQATKLTGVAQMALQFKDALEEFDNDDASIVIQPAWR